MYSATQRPAENGASETPSKTTRQDKQPRSTLLGEDEEALIVVAFRRHALLPLDDCLYALKPTLPHLTRSSLHRCLQRHDISRLPLEEGDKPERKRFKHCPIGYFHIDIAELRTAEGKLHRFTAIDRTSKFVFARLVERANTKAAAAFLDDLVAAVPCQVHTVLTDDGIEFADLARNRGGVTARLRGHLFERACRRHGIEHRLTKPNHPWTNAQAERMNRTVKEATVKRFHDESHARLRSHLDDFLSACNFARRLKTLRGLTPSNTSARSGHRSRKDSKLIYTIKPWDYTSSTSGTHAP